MTLNQIIYDIKEMFSAYSDDITLSDEHLAFIFSNKRSTYLRGLLSNLKREIPLEALQQICITLEEDELCEDDYIFLRSVEKIPETLEASGRSNIAQIFLNSRVARYINIIDYGRLPYIKGARMANKQIYFAVDPDSHLVCYSRSGNHEYLEDVKLNIVASNPEEAYKMACTPDTENCDFFDTEFPISADLIDPIKKEILNELVMKYRIPVDVVNNAEDDTSNKNKLDNGRQERTKV